MPWLLFLGGQGSCAPPPPPRLWDGEAGLPLPPPHPPPRAGLLSTVGCGGSRLGTARGCAGVWTQLPPAAQGPSVLGVRRSWKRSPFACWRLLGSERCSRCLSVVVPFPALPRFRLHHFAAQRGAPGPAAAQAPAAAALSAGSRGTSPARPCPPWCGAAAPAPAAPRGHQDPASPPPVGLGRTPTPGAHGRSWGGGGCLSPQGMQPGGGVSVAGPRCGGAPSHLLPPPPQDAMRGRGPFKWRRVPRGGGGGGGR